MNTSSSTQNPLHPAVEAEAAVSIIRSSQPVDSVLLLRRKKNPVDPWSGHFAFPGGRHESRDRDIYETCLRETYEETGIRLRDDLLKSCLDITPAGRNVNVPIMVQPYLFELEERPVVVVEELEIASYHWVEVHSFRDTRNHITVEVFPSRYYPVYPIDDYYLWGFTYKLLCSLLDVSSESIVR